MSRFKIQFIETLEGWRFINCSREMNTASESDDECRYTDGDCAHLQSQPLPPPTH